AADGAGHTLVLVNPSYGENDPRAWAHSARIGGNPGEPDPLVPDPADPVVFNEVLAHTDLPVLDFLELYNRSNNEVPLAGYGVTDDIRTNKFRFPPGTTLAPRAFLALDETQLGFRLSAAGETLYLLTPDGSRVLDALRFGGQENGVAAGRVPDGAPDFRRLAAPTPGAANAPRRLEDVVINEVMYHPITEDDDDEFIELHNRSAAAVSLAGWRFTAGVGFTFPAGAVIPAGGHVVVGANRDRLLANHPTLPPSATFGNWSGRLSDAGERIALARPDDLLSTNELGQVTVETIRIDVAEVAYQDGGRWGVWADGGGSSLELVDPRADPLRGPSWADSDETQKAAWQQFTVTSPLRFGGQTPDRLHLGLLGEGECLVDDVEVLGPTGTPLLTNGGFETGSGAAATGWSFLGHHSRSRVESTGAFSGSRVLRVIAPGDLDAGRNCIRATLAAGLNNDVQGTFRVRVRWQAGWPELLLRTRGGGLELTAAMTVPRNLGTPGAPNSRRVPNAGPAIHAVNHSPAVPEANQPVVVTARVADPDGVSSVNLRTRNGDTGAFSTTAMRDDGLAGDAVAGDGLWSATIGGRAAGTLVQFRIEAFDAAAPVASGVFPSGPVFAGSAPVTEANLRWGDPVPFGTFPHIHSWTSPTVDAALGADGLNNTYRDGTLVHGNLRVIYNAGIRRKGSPFTGQADFAVTVPADDLLLGTADRVYGLTGNGGEEATRMRNQVANWFTRSLRLPYLNAPYIRFFRNGSPHGSVGEDLEQPSNAYAESWFPDGGPGDLRKVAFWFEFRDDGGFDVTGADLGNYRNPDGRYNLSRYRWNWQGRPTGTSANNFTDFFNLVTAANDRSAAY
ncbi:MAG: lamin tail domain-containing protein, partial [Verrucomicrobiota bacterium]